MEAVLRKRPTCKDVARVAGVTQGLVSRALNHPAKVNPDTRKQIMKAVSKLKYRPSRYARSLRNNKHEAIGLVLMEGNSSTYRTAFIEGVSEILSASGNLVAICSVRNGISAKEVMELPVFRDYSVDGVIVSSGAIESEDVFLSQLDMPSVLVNSFSREFDSVVPDDFACGFEAVNYLIKMGHSKIAYIGGTAGSLSRHYVHPSIEARQRGYEVASLRANIKPIGGYDELLPATDKSDSLDFMKVLDDRLGVVLDEKPTVILTYNDIIALRVAELCYRRRLHLPDDISLMSCDDSLSLENSVCPVTTMSTCRLLQGQLTAKMILKKIENENKSYPSKKIEPRLMERKSVKKIVHV